MNGIIWAFSAISGLISPHPVETGPGYPPAALTDLNNYSRLVSMLFLTGLALQIGGGLTAFRKHERWVWFTLLSIPLVGVINSYIDHTWGPGAVDLIGSIIIFFIVSGLTSIALLMTIRITFFQRSV